MQSLYAVINCRGVFPQYVHIVWKLVVPPRVQIFLWLVSHNKILTRDNLHKRREVSDLTCLFCSEIESVHHLLFECCVATRTWEIILDLVGVNIGLNCESVAKLWLANQQFLVTNAISSAVMWAI